MRKLPMPSPEITENIKNAYSTLKSNLEGFEPRRHQNFMVSEIAKAISGDNENKFIVVEAGTGTGKSLGYLMSAIPVAKALGKKIVISTATVALQEQLETKDLPAYNNLIEPVNFVLAKGKSRYCCGVKLDRMIYSKSGDTDAPLLDFKPTDADIKRLHELAEDLDGGKWSGDRDSLKFPIRDQLWNTIASDSHICKPNKTHYKCSFFQARSKMNDADVIIANHNLVIADLNLGGGIILPEQEECIYVFDEAHHLPDIIRESTSCSFSISTSKQWLDNMIKTTKKLGKPLPLFGKKLINLSEYKDDLSSLMIQSETIVRQLDFTDGTFRFKQGVLFDSLEQLVKESSSLTRNICSILDKALDELKDSDLSEPEKDRIGTDLSFFRSRIRNVNDVLVLCQNEYGTTPCAKWVASKEGKFSLHASTLDPSLFLKPNLFERAFACVMTSATISTLGNFDFFKLETGIPQESVFTRLGSPFDYENIAELHVPNMSETPNTSEYTAGVIKHLKEYLFDGKHKGHLVLFTSYSQMNQVLDVIRVDIEKAGFNLGVQGEGSRNAILKEHKLNIEEGKTSILMGTNGLSEGLDLVGEYLESLVIVKLPFSVPNDPISEAYSELISSRGGNPFFEVSLPETSRKLIQSAGRLIRTKKDKGRCIILDNRIHTKRYGKSLINSLPPFKKVGFEFPTT